MSEWGVVLVIISLITLIAGVTGPVVKLNTNITKLNVILDGVKEDMSELKVSHAKDIAKVQEDCAKKRERIHNNIDKLDGRVDDHEKRITVLEGKG